MWFAMMKNVKTDVNTNVTLRFSERYKIMIKTTIGSSISMKSGYQNTIRPNPNNTMTNRILVYVEHGFVVNKIHSSIKKTVHKKMLCYM